MIFEKVLKAVSDPKQRQLRNRVIVGVLAVVLAGSMLSLGMALGRSSTPASVQEPSANADGSSGGDKSVVPVTDAVPTGTEIVENPENDYSCPRGGPFQFIGAGFVPGATLSVRIEGSEEPLGSFSVDAEGFVIPEDDPDASFATVIIPEQTTPGPITLEFIYDGGSLAFTLSCEVTANPYSASLEVTRDANSGARVLRVMSEGGTWAPGAEIYLTVDHQSSIYGVFEVGPDGSFDGLMTLPDELADGSTHIFTLSTAEMTVDGVLYPDASVSKTLQL